MISGAADSVSVECEYCVAARRATLVAAALPGRDPDEMCWSTVLARVMDTGDGHWNERMGSIDGVAARVGAVASARDQRVPVCMCTSMRQARRRPSSLYMYVGGQDDDVGATRRTLSGLSLPASSV